MEPRSLLSDAGMLPQAWAQSSDFAASNIQVEGRVVFEADVVIQGDVKFVNASGAAKPIAAGTYSDQTVEL